MGPPPPRPRIVGAIEITPVWDGSMPTPLAKVLGEAERVEAEALLAAASPQARSMDVYGFLLNFGTQLALIDSGAGGLMPPHLGKLRDSLEKLAIKPEQISYVFLTHLHLDHFGGLANELGKAVFPNAEIVLHEREAMFWLDSKRDDLPPKVHRYFDRIRDIFPLYANRIRRVADNENVLGITAHLAPGHTPGHTCWLVRSSTQPILAWGDLVHISEIQLPSPHISMEYDFEPTAARNSRARILEWAERERFLIAGAHLPFGGIGTIFKKDSGYGVDPN